MPDLRNRREARSLAPSALRMHPDLDAIADEVAEGRIDVYSATRTVLDGAGLAVDVE